MIFIHSLGQPLIVRSHSIRSTTAREEIPRKFPREPHVFPMIVTSLDSIDNKHGVQRQVRRCRRRRNFIYYIEYFRKAAGTFYYLVSDAKIFDIIYQLSPLLECDPTYHSYASLPIYAGPLVYRPNWLTIRLRLKSCHYINVQWHLYWH